MRHHKRAWLARFGWAGHSKDTLAPFFVGICLQGMEFDYGQCTRG